MGVRAAMFVNPVSEIVPSIKIDLDVQARDDYYFVRPSNFFKSRISENMQGQNRVDNFTPGPDIWRLTLKPDG